MAGAKEIRTKIKSIKNTQKITKAMEMVAASKMRKAQDRMKATRPYAEKMRNVIGHLALSHPEYKHPYMIERDIKRVGYIVVTSDRGLCGGLNVNLFKKTINDMIGHQMALIRRELWEHRAIFVTPIVIALIVTLLSVTGQVSVSAFDEAVDVAILGATGTGKSCSVALLLRNLLAKTPNAHLLLLDPHRVE